MGGLLKEEAAIFGLALVVALVYFAFPSASHAPDYSPNIWNALTGAANTGGGANLGGTAGGNGGAPPSDNAGQVVLSVNPNPALQGQPVSVQASVSGCPRASIALTLDGQPLSYDWLPDGSGLSTRAAPAVGHHRLALSAPGAGCQAAIEFDVQAAQCGAGQAQGCTVGGCPGTQACQDQLWGECVSLPHVCRPGQRVTCSSSSCSFGLAECNACGSGWLECRPPESYNN